MFGMLSLGLMIILIQVWKLSVTLRKCEETENISFWMTWWWLILESILIIILFKICFWMLRISNQNTGKGLTDVWPWQRKKANLRRRTRFTLPWPATRDITWQCCLRSALCRIRNAKIWFREPIAVNTRMVRFVCLINLIILSYPYCKIWIMKCLGEKL